MLTFIQIFFFVNDLYAVLCFSFLLEYKLFTSMGSTLVQAPAVRRIIHIYSIFTLVKIFNVEIVKDLYSVLCFFF